MFGLEHSCHFFEIEAITLLIQQRGKEDGDDALSDVSEVEVVVALHHPVHHPIHTYTPEKGDFTCLELNAVILYNIYNICNRSFGDK